MPTEQTGLLASVTLINRNGGERLRHCLSSCQRALERAFSSGSLFEFIVVDNGSTDDSLRIIASAIENTRYPSRLIREAHPGVNYARNAGLRAARGKYIVFTDSDLTFSEGWLEAYLRAFSQYPTSNVFAGRVLPFVDGPPLPPWLPTSGPLSRPSIVSRCDNGENPGEYMLHTGSVDGPIGPNMAFCREVFERHGEFDVRFGLRPGSLVPGAEAEYFDRLARAGLSFVYVPDALVWHPVDTKKLTKRYVLRRLFGIGRVAARLHRIRGVPCKRLFGITLYKFEHLLGSTWQLVRHSAGATPAERFFYLGEIMIHLGHIFEDWTTWWSSGRNDRKAAASSASQETAYGLPNGQGGQQS